MKHRWIFERRIMNKESLRLIAAAGFFFVFISKKEPVLSDRLLKLISNYLEASSIATATATVMPTMGLLPAPIKPIIST